MAKIKLSATRISTFLQCKLRYWYAYVKKLDKLENPAFKLGLACHTALEHAGNIWKSEGLREFSDAHKKDIIDVYIKSAVSEGIEEYGGFLEGKSLVESRIDNFAIGRKIIDLELKFGFPKTKDIFTATGVPLIGAIDKLVEIDDSTLLVIDYKTSMTVPEVDKLRTDVQLSMYNLIVKQLYPDYDRIILGLDMLRKSSIVYTYRTDKELEDFELYLDEIHRVISKLKEKDAVANLNMLCGWCDYRNVCDKYNEVCSNANFNFLSLSGMSDEDLISEWENVRARKKVLETREREINDIITEKIKVEELPVTDGNQEMVIRQNARTTYDPEKIIKVIPPEDFASLVSLSPTKLRKYLDKNTKIKPFVEETSETNYTSAFLAARKVKAKNKK